MSNKKKYTKVGTLWRNKNDSSKMFITMGDTKSQKFGFNAQVAAFKGSAGPGAEVLAKQENGILSIFPPKSENAPETLVGEIFIVENGEE